MAITHYSLVSVLQSGLNAREKIFLVICSVFHESKMPSFTKQVNYSLLLSDFHILYVHTPRCNGLSFFCMDSSYFCILFCTCSRPVKVNRKVRQVIHPKIVRIISFPETFTCFSTLQFEDGLERVHWVDGDTPCSMPDINIVFM